MKKIVLFTLLAIFIGQSSSYSQNEKFKAIFIYNFTKNIEWPKNMRQGNFVIGVLGSQAMVSELQMLAKHKKIGFQPIKVRYFSGINKLDNRCHVIYVPSKQTKYLPQTLEKVKKSYTLVVGDKKGVAKNGAGINFYRDGTKMKFEISRRNIEQQGLKVSSKLIQLGKLVD